MTFALITLFFLIVFSLIMSAITLVTMLNLRLIEIEDKNHWLNKVILFHHRRLQEITADLVSSGTNPLGLGPVDATTWKVAPRWMIPKNGEIIVINLVKNIIFPTSPSELRIFPGRRNI